MWWHLSSQDSRLATETDLVLAYLRSYFYDDPGLATVLLTLPSAIHSSVSTASWTIWLAGLPTSSG